MRDGIHDLTANGRPKEFFRVKLVRQFNHIDRQSRFRDCKRSGYTMVDLCVANIPFNQHFEIGRQFETLVQFSIGDFLLHSRQRHMRRICNNRAIFRVKSCQILDGGDIRVSRRKSHRVVIRRVLVAQIFRDGTASIDAQQISQRQLHSQFRIVDIDVNTNSGNIILGKQIGDIIFCMLIVLEQRFQHKLKPR